MELLKNIVEDCLNKYVGGELFFDNLDLLCQNTLIVDEILKHITENNIIVSGKFGRFINNYCIEKGYNVIVVNGGLRVGKQIDDLTYVKDNIKNKNFVFLDDSFYSGKTRDKIQTELEKQGSKLIKTYVIYDGSKIKDNSVVSLYRYYDNYK